MIHAISSHLTRRKRLRSCRPKPQLPPPPPPNIELDLENLYVISSNLNNDRGLFVYRSSHTPGGPVIDEVEGRWCLDDSVPLVTFLPRVYLHVVEIGNGATYAGESPRSNELFIPG